MILVCTSPFYRIYSGWEELEIPLSAYLICFSLTEFVHNSDHYLQQKTLIVLSCEQMLICMNDGNGQGRLAVHFPRQELIKFSHAFLFVLSQAVLSMNSSLCIQKVMNSFLHI